MMNFLIEIRKLNHLIINFKIFSKFRDQGEVMEIFKIHLLKSIFDLIVLLE